MLQNTNYRHLQWHARSCRKPALGVCFSGRLVLCRVAVVSCVGQFEPVLEGSVRLVLHSRDVNWVNRRENINLSASSAMSTFSPVGLLSSNSMRMCVS